MAKKVNSKVQFKSKEEAVPAVRTSEKGIHFSPRFVGLLADEVAKTVSQEAFTAASKRQKKEKPQPCFGRSNFLRYLGHY